MSTKEYVVAVAVALVMAVAVFLNLADVGMYTPAPAGPAPSRANQLAAEQESYGWGWTGIHWTPVHPPGFHCNPATKPTSPGTFQGELVQAPIVPDSEPQPIPYSTP